ncbi:MAG: hypothetical protein KDC88_06745 [Ignavibacteriae bacterium]|nr:hypothetical protein [Ignavibacteriota bacterium]MCB9207040.1 hypothetical protein [Ignavibacteriales bacterium]MCB9207789.1 hypothetical protein [Ignavibacteriales bacterium]MCB9258559.1 hypothetical protein [Ignavibacteriales bacterium]
MPRSYAQKVKQSIDNMYRHQAQSKKDGNYLEDLVVARNRLEDYHNVIKWLNRNGFSVEKGGIVMKREQININNRNKNAE